MKDHRMMFVWSTTCLMISAVNGAVITYNAALNRPAYQSSVHTNSYGNYPANLANDGNRDTHFVRDGVPTCSHSQRENNPWWAVDLGRPTTVYRVDLTNRGDGYEWRSNNFIVGLTNVHPLISTPTLWKYTLCGQYPGAVPRGATVYLYCPYDIPSFRYIIVQFPLKNDHLNFCELEVIAPVTNEDLRNVALNKPSFQVSTYTDQFGSHGAHLANDGSRQTNFEVTLNGCAASNPAINPWWTVDLGGPTLVARINLTNRGDSHGNRSDNFIVGLTNNHPVVHAPVLWNYTLCGQYPGAVPYGATVGINCINVYQRRLRFRYVIVQFPLLDDRMNFCEIEVFTVDISYNTTTTTTDHYSGYTTVDLTPTTTTETSATLCATEKSTMDENKCAESNPLLSPIIVISLLAGVLIIVAVTLLITLLKQRADVKELRQLKNRVPESTSQGVYCDNMN